MDEEKRARKEEKKAQKKARREEKRRARVEKHVIICPHCGKNVLDHMSECPYCKGLWWWNGQKKRRNAGKRNRLRFAGPVAYNGSIGGNLWKM